VYQAEIRKTVQANYLLYIPPGYGKQGEEWPLILFLHGAGERGDDVEKVKIHGPAKLAGEGKDFPFIILSPQCPEEGWWPTDFVMPLLDEVVRRQAVDEDRIYLTGLSMGGFGTWALAIEHPERFAAIAPICGGGDPKRVSRIKHVPVWVFHGAKDEVVPMEKSEVMVKALEEAGGDVKFTVYPEATHDSWTETYNNPELYEWFLSHRRGE